ncbi:MAG: acyltransferase [Sporichthyaceae bacterium]|nr:acyltransferase [Sporichthyaceae bacterium]
MATLSATQLATQTPADHDRYVDLLRAGSLGVVILGHWLMAVVIAGPHGPVATNALALLPALQPATWLLQVMPLFFFVGGFSHAVALDSLRRRGLGYAEFVRIRAGRLLLPTSIFVACWIVIAIGLERSGQDHGLAAIASRVVAQPLWFVGVYLGVITAAPAMLRWHRGRHGATALPLLLVGVAAVDYLRIGYGWTEVGYLNVALVWLVVHQLGFWYADHRLDRPWVVSSLAAGGLTGLAALTTLGPYPVSMVGLPGERISNMAPPTLALLCQAAWLIGLAMLVRPAARRWLVRPRVWLAVVRANGIAMTAFLWHLTGMFVAAGGLLLVGLPDAPVGSRAWWVQRVAWVGVAALTTAVLVASFRWADRHRAEPVAAIPRLSVGMGMLASVLGVLGLSAAGFGGQLVGGGARLVVLPVTPLGSAVLLGAGLLALGIGPGARLRSRAKGVASPDDIWRYGGALGSGEMFGRSRANQPQPAEPAERAPGGSPPVAAPP